jgi:predicted esterase YcpF (UPF0227 family)
MKILYIHGYNGSPAGQKVERIQQAYPKAEVIALQHDSVPTHVFEQLDPIASKLDGLKDAVIGNSLGGFWANFFSLRYGIPALLINPVVSPVSTLKLLGCDFADDYSIFEQQINPKAISTRTVLLAEDDEVLPCHEAFEFFKDLCVVKLLKSGGHSMNDEESLNAIVRSYDELMSNRFSWGTLLRIVSCKHAVYSSELSNG